MNCRSIAQAVNVSTLALTLVLTFIASPGIASTLPQSEDQVDAQSALESAASRAWYDEDTGSFKPPNPAAEPEDNPIRTDGYRSKPKPPKQEKTRTSWNLGNWGLTGLSDAFSAMVLFLLASVLIAIVGFLAYHALREYRPARNKDKITSSTIAIDPTKVVDLPFEAKPAAGNDPLAEAERLMRLGNYNDAILFLYGYQLLALDRSRKIELEKGKTNRTYARELGTYPRLRSILETTMLAFEDVYFGKHVIDEARFVQCWNRLPEFHQYASVVTDGGPHPTAQLAPL